eukprot:scaffold2058_cov69-Phaeocystis_antarctica.AAC.8
MRPACRWPLPARPACCRLLQSSAAAGHDLLPGLVDPSWRRRRVARRPGSEHLSLSFFSMTRPFVASPDNATSGARKGEYLGYVTRCDRALLSGRFDARPHVARCGG